MENNSSILKPVYDPIAEKLNDADALTKVVQQAVTEAVTKAQKLGFLPETKEENKPSQ
jgi:hypothetical protein